MNIRRTITVLCGLSLLFMSVTESQAQIYFEASGLLLDRDNDSGTSLISGNGGLTASNADFTFEPAYRFNAGVGIYDWEVDGSYTRLHNWEAQQSGFLSNVLVLDETAGNAIVVPTLPANTLGFVNSLVAASTGGVEALESERLQPGASYLFEYESQYDDLELSIGTNRMRLPVRASIGYRYVRLDEMSSFSVIGVFDALDSDDAAVSGDATNDPNDALAHGSLIGAGLSLISGAGDGFDAADVAGTGPDTLSLYYGGMTENRLHGGQVSFAVETYADDRLILEGTAKLGLYYNRARGEVSELISGSGNDDSVYGRTLSDSASVGSFVGGLGLRGIWGITGHLSVTAGYEAVFLSNIALSADQPNGIGMSAAGLSDYSVVTDGDVLIHGGQLGLNVTW